MDYLKTVDGKYYAIKEIEIGDWDMDVATMHFLAHGLADHTKIRRISATVRNDLNTLYYPLDRTENAGVVAGGVFSYDDTEITLNRTNGSLFDQAAYSTPPDGNRGWVTIEYDAT